MPVQKRKKTVLRARPTIEGAGVRLKRALGFGEAGLADPFLLLDHFCSGDPDDYMAGFPWHPHRGIETITYMLEGSVEHGDSMENMGVINAGDVQWMTAGSGIVHQEMPKGDEKGRMHGFQLWSNLPAGMKMMDPRYREVKSGTIPVIRNGRAEIRLIAGSIGGVMGPVRDIVTDPEYLDVTLEPHAVFDRNIKHGHTTMAYMVEGSADFGGPGEGLPEEPEKYYSGGEIKSLTGEGHLIIFGDGDNVRALAGEKGARFLLISGRPLKEPIAWYGPIVMNTEAELRTAFREYQEGTFLKKK